MNNKSKNMNNKNMKNEKSRTVPVTENNKNNTQNNTQNNTSDKNCRTKDENCGR